MRGRTLALFACLLAFAAVAPVAGANPPAVGQYHLQQPSSGAAKQGDSTAPAPDSSGGSSAAVLILGAGLVAVAGGLALVYWRRRPRHPGDLS